MRACVSATVVVCLLALQQGSAARVISARADRTDGPKVLPGALLISEFRLRGPNGPNDEFIEIYNTWMSSMVVGAQSGTGFGIAASDGVTRCTIPNGTVIPSGGHYLCVNSAGYSLASYPAGNGTTATGDATYTLDIPDYAGLAIFNNDVGGASYSLVNRLDAVGPTTTNALYKEGTGYNPILNASPNASLTRRSPGGCTGSGGPPGGNCGSVTLVQTLPAVYLSAPSDTDDNARDFIFVDTEGWSAGDGQRLGAPGPENLSSPGVRGIALNTLVPSRLDSCAAPLLAPNQFRDATPDPDNTAMFGTYEFRRAWTNTSGSSITRLRFRIVDITTFPAAPGVADYRAHSSTDMAVTVDRPPCGTGTSSVIVHGTTLEQPPGQAYGGGYNTSLSVGAVTAGTPLASGASIDVRFVLGIQQRGMGRFCVIPETLPSVTGKPFCVMGDSEAASPPGPADFDHDGLADMPLVDTVNGPWKVGLSSSGYTTVMGLNSGGTGVVCVPGDYDGDGRLDVALYVPSFGYWAVNTSSSFYLEQFIVSGGERRAVPVPGDYDGDRITDLALYNPITSLWTVLTSTSEYRSSVVISWGGMGYTPVGGQDFDGDGKADLAVYKESSGTWYVLKSSTNFTTAFTANLGGVGYTLVPGDYDGDGKADVAVYSRSTGDWSVLTSTTSYASGFTRGWGGPGYLPVPGDFDGDGKNDLAVYSPGNTSWFVLKSASSYTTSSTATFGTATDSPISSAIIPVPSRDVHAGDFDGDFVSDITTYNSATGAWSILKSSTGFTSGVTISWGGAGYNAVPADYDGDGRGDLGLYQPSTGNWYVLLSSANFTTSLSRSVGGAGYIPVPGDYDGDGKADFVVYNTTTGLWYGLTSSTGYTTTVNVSWGGPGYTAVPGDFDGDGKLDLGVYQASSGTWSILRSNSGYTRTISRNFGGAGYVPVQGDYDGDGITDFATYQPSTGMWAGLMSSAGSTRGFSDTGFLSPSFPVAGDWDGDRRADIAYFDPGADWLIFLSSGGFVSAFSGGAGWLPVTVYP